MDKALRDLDREIESMDKPWGYDVRITFHDGSQKTFKKAGKLSAVNRWAILKTGHRSHEIMATYTRRQWIAAYGDGRIRM